MQDKMEFDVIVVGAGIAGLSCAIRLAKLNKDKKILVLEKAERIGGHLLSGAIVRVESLGTLLTQEELSLIQFGPLVSSDSFHMLTSERSFKVPFVPPKMRATYLPLISISKLGSALGEIAMNLGVEVITSQTADSLVFEKDKVIGVKSVDDILYAPVTVLAEGAAGLLTKDLLKKFPHLNGKNCQTYGLGIKEVFEVPNGRFKAGMVLHTFGYPLNMFEYGGGFIYHIDETHVLMGMAIALDYSNPSINVHELFRQWKRHPLVHPHIEGGRPIEYGAKLVPEGGYYSVVTPNSEGVIIVGDSAGFVDVMELKGIHLAVESGIEAADSIVEGRRFDIKNIRSFGGLKSTKNYRASFKFGLFFGMMFAGLSWISKGILPFGRIRLKGDRGSLRPLGAEMTVDRAPELNVGDMEVESDLFLANLRIRDGIEHISIKSQQKCERCFEIYGAPCLRFCPATVYVDSGLKSIKLRPENCVQCRCCTIKCPYDNILWITPRYGIGPDYTVS